MMSDKCETVYHAIPSECEYEDDDNDEEPIIHIIPDKNQGRWNHIENLDEFFTRVYHYHQRGGFLCMIVQDICHLIQYSFVIMFAVFLMKCVDYDKLFYERWNSTSPIHDKVSLSDGVYSFDQCVSRFNPLLVICLVAAALCFVFKVIKFIYNGFLYAEIRAFYVDALNITADELSSKTWHEVQARVLVVQTEQEMCIHRRELNELDIYHRILRFKNYMVAMTNKNILPIKHKVPFLGEYTFFTTGLKYNVEMLLFWGPGAPFENYWHLKSEFKDYRKRKENSKRLSRNILIVGIINLVLSPVIMLWQILYSFFRYAETLKRAPSILGARRWSIFARHYLRHFNELDHEIDARLNRGYKPAQKYMDNFSSMLLTIIAKNVAFIAGSVLAVFVILTLIDEDFLYVQHVLLIMSIMAAVIAICNGCIPDENIVHCPEFLMKAVLAQIHYVSDAWKLKAHTFQARDEFSVLYQYKFTYLIEELLSPVITPLLLIFVFRHKALDIVDFYRNFTVDVAGVGDVCSFAQMDIRKHGNPQWVPEDQTEATQYQQTEGGKTEISLVHFTLTNPNWKPPLNSVNFITSLKEQVQNDRADMSLQPLDNPLANSLHSLNSLGMGYNSMYQGCMSPSTMPQAQMNTMSGDISQFRSTLEPVKSESPTSDGLKNMEGPEEGSNHGLLASLHVDTNDIPSLQPHAEATMMPMSQNLQMNQRGHIISRMNPVINPLHPALLSSRHNDQATLEYMSTEMSFSALYLHELHQKKLLNPQLSCFRKESDAHAKDMWKSPTEENLASSQDPSSFNLRASVQPKLPSLENSNTFDTGQETIYVGGHLENEYSGNFLPKSVRYSLRNPHLLSPEESADHSIAMQPLAPLETDLSLTSIPQVQGPFGSSSNNILPQQNLHLPPISEQNYTKSGRSTMSDIDEEEAMGEKKPLIERK